MVYQVFSFPKGSPMIREGSAWCEKNKRGGDLISSGIIGDGACGLLNLHLTGKHEICLR